MPGKYYVWEGYSGGGQSHTHAHTHRAICATVLINKITFVFKNKTWLCLMYFDSKGYQIKNGKRQQNAKNIF